MTPVRTDPQPTIRPATTTESSPAGDPMGLSLTLHHPRPGRVLVRAHGEVDLGTVDALRSLLDRADREPDPITGLRPDHVMCDLGGVTFLAAVGVGALAEAGDTARQRGAHLSLIASNRLVRRVLQLCGLDGERPIASRLADALVDVPDQVSPDVSAPGQAVSTAGDRPVTPGLAEAIVAGLRALRDLTRPPPS